MALMSVEEWRKRKAQQGTVSSSAPSVSSSESSSSNKTTGESSRLMSVAEWRAQRATKSAQGWADAANALLKETQQYFGSWRGKDDEGYYSIQERNSALLAQADSWRKQYAGDDEVISYIDSVVSALSDARQNSKRYLDYYGQWDSEDAFKKWEQYSTAEGRQEQYAKNKARLEELQKQKREGRNYQPGMNPYLSGESTTPSSPYGAAHQNPNLLLSESDKEIEQIKKEMRLYETGEADETGFYYGSKVVDEYGNYLKDDAFVSASGNRNFRNADRAALDAYDAEQSEGSTALSNGGYMDEDGNIRDARGNIVQRASAPEVQDKLGLFLSASDNDIVEAYNILSASNGNYETTWAEIMQEGDTKRWKYLEDSELQIYYGLLNTEGQESAYRYLDAMEVELGRREMKQTRADIDEASGLEQIMLNVASVPMNMIGGVAATVDNASRLLQGKDLNPYSRAQSLLSTGNYIRYNTAQEIDEATGGIAIPGLGFSFGDAYQAGMSMVDSLVGARIGGKAYQAVMSMGAASSEAAKLYSQGASMEQIVLGSMAAGAAEWVFEKYSIENLISLKSPETLMQFAKNALIQGGIELSEEAATEFANIITNGIIMQSESDWAKLLEENGGDYGNAVKEMAIRIANAGLGGFISGMGSGSIQQGFEYGAQQKANKELGQFISGANSTDALVALALDMASNESGKTQKNLKSQSQRIMDDEFLTKGGKNRATGRLYNTVRSTVTDQNISEISTALQEKGFSKKDASAIAGAVAVQASGIELTDKQQKVLEKFKTNKDVQTVLDEVLGNEESGINQRARSIAKFDFNTTFNHIASKMEQSLAQQENATDADTIDTQEKEATESSYEVSAEGKTILKSTGEIVNIQDVADIRDGKMTLRLDNGSVVDSSEVSYASQEEALVYETVAQMGASVKAANILVKGFKSAKGLSASEYARGIEEAFDYGKKNDRRGLEKSEFASKLNPGQQDYVYRQGQKAAGKQVAKEQATVLKNRTVAESAVKESRSYQATLEDGISEEELNESQKVSYRLAGQIAEAAKVNIRVYASKTGEHGYYNPVTDEIYLNLNATNKSRKSMMAFTLGHELVHRAKKGSPAKYKAFANFLVEQYGKQGSSVDDMIGEELAAAKRFKIEMTPEQAFEEVVCDACERMLLDTDAGKKLAEFGAQSKENKSFLDNLKQWIEEFLEKIRSIFADVDPDSMAAKEFAKFDESVKQILADMYVDMTIDAGENMSVIHSVVKENAKAISSDEIITDGAVVTDGSELKYSIKSMKADIAEGQMFEDLKTFCGWTQKQVDELRSNLTDLIAYMTPFRDIVDMNETYGREGRRFSPYKPNSDPLYKISMDFSTLCSKRLLTQYVIENLQLRENRPMTAEEQMAIRHMLNEYRKVEKGLQVACAMCYVEAARLKSPKQITKWMSDPATQMKNYFADKNPEFAAYIKEKQSDFKESRGYARNATKKDMSAKDVRELNQIRPRLRSQYQISAEEAKIIERAKELPNSTYLTAANLANLSETDPVIYSAYTAFVRTATRSKSLETDEPYYYGDSRRDNGNGIVVTDSFIEEVNRENGMRFSSWSDWRIQHLLDYITAVIDNSVRGAAMHGYTKFGEEVRVLGKTGMMFNMSGVAGTQTGLNEDGSLSFSPTESIDVNEAIKLREEFPETAGLQCIGVSDDHIIALLRSDIIDYIIPYHVSGLNAGLRAMANIHGWADYTTTQHAAIDKSMKLAEAKDQEHWHEEPVFSEFFVGYNTGMTGIEAMKESAKRYVQMCKDRGLKPKFEQFVKEENYWKLLVDRKMINQKTGKLIQQKAVTPTFDFGTIKEVVDQYVQNYDSGLEARALNHIVENWDSIPKHIRDLKKQGSKKAKKASKAVDTLANQTLAAQPKGDERVFSLPKGEPAPTFYSHMARVVDGVKQEKLGAASVVSMLRGKGVKAEEIKWSGIETFLEGKKSVTKAELQEFIAGSMLQIVEEQSDTAAVALRFKGNDTYKLYDAAGNVLDTFIYNEFMGGYISEKTDEIYSYTYEIEDAVREEYGNQSLPRWADYKLDGGSNYREIVFRLPDNSYSNQAMRIHWGDDAEGVLAHARIQDFDTAIGRMLFVEELQSDYHNEGHESGYADSKTEKKIEALKAVADSKYLALEDYSTEMTGLAGEWDTVQKTVEGARLLLEYREAQDAYDQAMNEYVKKIPDAPFKDTYHEYVMKRLLRMAAEEGYDSIGWTPSEIQVKRWSEEFAEGYRIEYDQEIPKFMNKYGKKWGTKVGTEYLATHGLTPEQVQEQEAELLWLMDESDNSALQDMDIDIDGLMRDIRRSDNLRQKLEALKGTKVWSMPITESMKQSVLTEGQPLYSLPKNPYSYDNLISKPDMVVTTVGDNVPKNRADVVYMAKQNAAKVGKFNPKDGSVSVHVDDVDADVVLATNGLKHSLDRRFDVNAAVVLKAGEIIKNSIRINEVNPKKANVKESYVLIGAARNSSGEIYVVRSVVNRFSYELASMDVLYAINAKKEPAALLPRLADDSAIRTGSTISIAGLLDYVNQYFPDILPEEVLKHYGYDARPEGELGEDALYKLPVGEDTSPRALLANAFEGVAQNDIERRKIQEYQEKISLINAEEKKLKELREQIKDLSFAKGPKDTEKIRSLQFEAMQASNRINTYDLQLLRLEASKPLQDVVDREKEMARKRAEQKGKEALAEYRERVAKTQRELLDKWQASREKAIDSRQRTAMRHKIKNVVNDLNQYLLKGTKERHVPIGLQKAVAEALNAVNMDTIGAEERIAKLQQEMMRAKTPEAIQEISKKIEHIREMGDRMDERLKKLKEAYDEFINSDDPMIANSHDDGMSAHMMKLIVRVGDTPLREMTVSQLQDVYDVYKVVLATIRNANKSFKDNKNREISTRANQVMAEIDNLGVKKGKSIIGFDWVNKFGWDNLKPVYAMEHIGSRGLIEAYNNVRAGEDTWAKDIVEAREFYLEKFKKYKYDSWDFEKKYKFTSTTGKDFELTLDQIMSLYAYSKRDQAEDHLKYGGIVFDPKTEVVEKTKSGIKVKYNVANATAYNISADTLAEIISILKDEQTDFVDEMQAYLSDVMGAKGNEVSLAMYDVKLFREKHYFPLKSAPQYMAKAKEQAMGEVKIKNSGFSKETKPHAKNPIVLSSFMDVWTNHVNEMSMYHAFVLPMEDFYRIYNYSTPSKAENMPTEGVTAYIENAYGTGATGYIEQMLKDLNGGARNDPRANIANNLMGRFKKGAVFASASVVVQQPSAIARAAALIDIKHFIGPKVDAKRHKLLWNEVKQYAPVAIIKEMGYFDTNMGKSTQDFIQGKEYSGFGEKAKALVTDSNYRDEVLSKAPALADELAWCSIWEAVKRETKERNPKMDVRSEEFLKLAGERFTEVIVKTQVYDSVLARSANMRSKDGIMKMVTAFMAEPTTSINMIGDALLKGKRGDKKYCRKAIGSVIASVILNSFLVAFVQAARDDDEEESYAEKYIGSFTAEMLEGLNPLTYIPFIKDIVSIVQGYDVERSDMSVFSDVVNALRKLTKEDVSAWRKVEDFVGSICNFFGLPVKNIMRDTRAVWQAFNTIVNGENATKRGIGYAIKGAVTGKDVSNPDQLYESRLAKDKAHEARVAARYEDEDSANAAVRQAIKNRFLEDKIDKATALREMVLYAGMDGVEAYWLMDAWEYRKETGSDEGYGKFNDLYDAVKTGKNLKAVIKEYTGNGVEMSTLTSQITQHFKPEYIKMSVSQRAGIKGYLLNAYEQCGMKREDAQDKLAEWDFEAKHGYDYGDRKKLYLSGELSKKELRTILIETGGYEPEDADAQIEAYDWEADGYEGATVAAVQKYNEFCAAYDVPRNIFLHIRKFSGNTENDVDENGKSINYSAMKKVMAEINAQQLTAEQKTAIAKSLGWSDKNIRKYKPW